MFETKICISQPLKQIETQNKKNLRALAFGFYCKVFPFSTNQSKKNRKKFNSAEHFDK